jgi:hypothetical protein
MEQEPPGRLPHQPNELHEFLGRFIVVDFGFGVAIQAATEPRCQGHAKGREDDLVPWDFAP